MGLLIDFRISDCMPLGFYFYVTLNGIFVGHEIPTMNLAAEVYLLPVEFSVGVDNFLNTKGNVFVFFVVSPSKCLINMGRTQRMCHYLFSPTISIS